MAYRDAEGGGVLDSLISEPLSDDFGRLEFIKERQKKSNQNECNNPPIESVETPVDDVSTYSTPNDMLEE